MRVLWAKSPLVGYVVWYEAGIVVGGTANVLSEAYTNGFTEDNPRTDDDLPSAELLSFVHLSAC